MTDGRFALIIANNEYEDHELKKLDAPASDAEVLEKVLKDPEIGGFEVKRLSNEPWHKLREEINNFFTERRRDDLLFIYFACHGIKDEDGRLYFATANTYRKNLTVSGIDADFVNQVMFRCRSRQQVLLLDCCYGGAFASGFIPRANKEVDTKEHFKEGRGKVVITASDAMQFAFEEEKLVEKEQIGSIFTRALVDGLKTGEADRDNDGLISEGELYDYIYEHVTDEKPSQTPRKWVFDVEGEIVIAKNKNKIVVQPPEEEPIDSEYLLKLLQDSKIEEFNKLRNEHDIPLYFRRADLSGKNLIGADLHEADLRESKLINTKLSIANLKGTKLGDADLSGADLRSVDLYGSNLTKATLSKADLRGADLKGMIDFTGANLTGADLRAADLKGMVNFESAVLRDVDFTGSFIDSKLINFNGADTHNAKGLPSIQESNEYLEALKSFSEAINQQFKSHNISPERLKPIEESIKELAKEVQDIKEPEKIALEQKRSLKQKFINIIQKVIQPLPKSAEASQHTFTTLSPFGKLIGDDVQPLVGEAFKNEANIYHSRGEYNEALDCYDKAIEINPNDADAWNGKASALYNLKRYKEAIECYDKAIAIDPNNTVAHEKKKVILQIISEGTKSGQQQQQQQQPSPINTSSSSPPIFSSVTKDIDDPRVLEKARTEEAVSQRQPTKITDDSVKQVTGEFKPGGSPVRHTPTERNDVSQSKENTYTSVREEEKFKGYYPTVEKHPQQKNLKLLIPIIIVAVVGSIIAFAVFSTITQTSQQYSFVRAWGSSGTGNGQFSSPEDIAIDRYTGYVYVSDYYNHRIQKFTSEGTFISSWGSSGTGNGQFSSPEDIAIDSSGYVYVADTGNNRIQKFTSEGTFISSWGSSGTGNGQFYYPRGIFIDPSDYVYVADSGNDRIEKFTADGTFITEWSSYASETGHFYYPTGIAIDPSGDVYVADGTEILRVLKFDSDGNFITSWGSKGSGEGQFLEDHGIGIDPSGDVYVADSGNERIQKFTSEGTFISSWGSSGTGNGQFSYPRGIAIDSSGDVYVADFDNNRIQVFAPVPQS